MIIPGQKKEIKVNNHSLEHYKKLGYDVKCWGIITVPPEHLTNGSTVKIKVKCDKCGNEKELSYSIYLDNTKNNTEYYGCSLECSKSKKIKTCLKKYGFEVSSQSPKVKEKAVQTCLKNHGVEYPMQSQKIFNKSDETRINKYGDKNYRNIEKQKETVRNKSEEDKEETNNRRIETTIKKYGVRYILQSKEIQGKIKQTNLKNLGVEFPLQSKEIQEKCIETFIDKYGVKNPSKSPEIIEKIRKTKEQRYGDPNYCNPEKIKKTCLEKYGVENVFQNKEIKEQIKQTNLLLYGFEYPSQNKEISIKQIETMTGMIYEEYIKSLPDFKKYEKEVLKFTRKQSLNLLENIKNRGQYTYHLDHMFTISEGFRNSILPYIIGNIINLEMLTWKENQKKHSKCSLTEEELFERFDNREILLEQLKENYNNKQKLIK